MRRKNSMLYKCLTFALTALLLHISLGTALAIPPQIIAKLVTTGGSIKVNGNNLPSGSSIVSGATIETPDNVTATIEIPGLGTVELQEGTIASIEFSGNNIKLTLKKGCASLKTNEGTTGSVVNDQDKLLTTNDKAGVAAQSNGKKSRVLPTCGAVFGGNPPATTAAGTGGGLSSAAIGAIIAGVAGGAVIIGIVGARGGNNSPSRP